MPRRPRILALLLIVAALLGVGGAVVAQLEPGDRGIMPIDSSGLLEVSGIHVDVAGKDAMSARYAGWRIAQRQGFKALWAKAQGQPIGEAPDLSDPVLDSMVSSIIVEREQIGPNRYIADLGVQFDRSKAGELVGASGEVRHSAPMLLIPITISGGAETSVEIKNAWQRAWAQFRTSQSPIDYVRVSGLGIDPLLINAAQTDRPGRSWWRNLVDYYGAADVLTAEVSVQRLYPGGPARAQFIGRHGPDNEIIGGFILTAANSEGVPQMMNEGVRRMDDLFASALAAGRLERDSTLDTPEPPPPAEDVAPLKPPPVVKAGPTAHPFQVQIVASNVNTYNFAMAHLRTLAGIGQVTTQSINPTGTSYVLVTYPGDAAALAAALAARGWTASGSGSIVRMSGGQGPPPPLPPPPPTAPPQPGQASTSPQQSRPLPVKAQPQPEPGQE